MDNIFKERLEQGEDYEDLFVEFMKFFGLQMKKNNGGKNYRDVDLYCPKYDFYLDVKYLKASKDRSIYHEDLDEKNCLMMNLNHHKAYAKKTEETGKPVWVATYVDFEHLGVVEMVIINNADLEKLRLEEKGCIRINVLNRYGKEERKINYSRKYCMKLEDFIIKLKNGTLES